MAAIKNSISLQDRMTPVFRTILKSMDSTLRVMRQLDKQANKGTQSKAYRRAQRDIQRANNELIKMQNHLRNADRSASRLSNTTKSVSTNMSSANFNLSNFASALYLLKNIANTISDVMTSADSLTALEYRLATYDTTNASGSQLMDATYEAAMNSRSDWESTSSLASRILISGATDGDGARAVKLAELLNKASFIGGSSEEESKRALLQLSQGLSSGVLQGDELRSIREQSPGLTDVLAKGLSSLAKKGVLPENFLDTTIGDLKSLGQEGELTADRIVAAFEEMSDYVDETFASSPKLFEQAGTQISNIWQRWLKMMSEGDNALGRLNAGMWELVDWLESDAGDRFFASLAKGVDIAVNLIFGLIDVGRDVVNTFKDVEGGANLLKAALIAVGVVAVAAGVAAAAAWVKACWPILLAAAIITIVVYALLEAGVTMEEIVGNIAGVLLFLGYSIYDVVVWVVNVVLAAITLIWDILVIIATGIISLIVGIGSIIILVCQAVVQIILWVLTTIWGIFVTIYNIGFTLVKGLWGVFKTALMGIVDLFIDLAKGAVGALKKIAEAVDKVFDTNLAGTLNTWLEGLDSVRDDIEGALDPMGEFEDIEDQWVVSYRNLADQYAGKGEYDDWFIGDNMADVATFATDFLSGTGSAGADLLEDPSVYISKALDGTVNPMDGYYDGYDFGSSILTGMSDLGSGLFDVGGTLDELISNGVGVNGGDLDSVGSIKSDVDISDEDLKLLKEMAARDFLLNLQTITPQANVTFGDVRETADVDKIMEVIQDMVDEELATSLVVS